jgi:diaminopimelate decarboxylase
MKHVGLLSPVLIAAARAYGTPVYVIDMATVGRAAAELEAAFPAPWVLQYSLKANDLPAISAYLHSRGWGGNVVSSGEWQFARYAGVGNSALTFEGIGKTDAQLEYAVREAVGGRPLRWLAVESASEAEQLAAFAAQHRLGQRGREPLDVLLRLNPQVAPETRAEFAVGSAASKFGMIADEIRALLRDGILNMPGLRLRGIQVHTGSDLREVGAWADAGVHATRLLREIIPRAPHADTVDFGGGFPLSSEEAPGPARFHAALLDGLEAEGLDLPARVAIEPGRYLVGDAGWLVTSVLHSRPARDEGQAMAVLDAGMTEFIRPALYGSHHTAHALQAEGELRSTSLEGPVCESTDTLGTHRLPPLRRGDIVAIERAGAYSASFTSRYNGRPAPPEVLHWPDGSLERCHRPEIPVMAPEPATDRQLALRN